MDNSEFKRLLDRLAEDIREAAIFRKLHVDLIASFNEFRREFNESNTFWYLSFQAYLEVALHRLNRIYVGHNDALSLGSWLEAIKNNPQLFVALPDPVQLDQDIRSVEDDPIVKKLVKLRGNIVAHINWNNVAKNLKLGDRFALSFGEIDVLISRASDILNRYSVLFNQESWSTPIVGHDDFQTILKALRGYLERMNVEIAKEIEGATRAAGSVPGTVA